MRNLSEILKGVNGISLWGSTDRQIKDMFLDSRLISEGCFFVALSGTQVDGHDYISQAIEKGATAVLCEQLPENYPKEICFIQCENSREVLGEIAANFFGNPSEALDLIGITGTNGKTSIATWLYHLLKDLGYPAGLLSTITILINDKEYSASHTTPDVISLNRYLAMMVDAGCQYAVMEVSSHALEQGRTAGLRFRAAIFTNLTRDHLDYHLDFSSYLAAKKLLFDDLPAEAFAFINTDDKHARIMTQNCSAKVLTYASRSVADYKVKIIEQHQQGMSLMIDDKELWTRVIGRYNALNLLAVYAVACSLSLPAGEVLRSLSKLEPVEGRMELVDLGHSVTAVVDYAHTPDALKNVLQALEETRKKGSKIITVVGTGGDRDHGKRPVMAQIAFEHSDRVIFTSDNPRTEDPEKIIEEMLTGLTDNAGAKVLSIVNRREAIKTAVALAADGDLILVAGKGHETYQEIDGVRFPFDDVDELRKLRL
ncbi:MAG: UDP-N-acetylmuramoyl-L-alanyl-D-glutamate--2,6-diaminopimelate ligase [Bacteroidales bacterium]|nr:UDP-N-acetylmuramoyl-L-alanyl-D-glutamate--2,6-diaminopimelate ligase [Bacteroidales bacterium]